MKSLRTNLERHAGLILAVCALITFGYLLTCDFTFWDDAHTVHQNPLLNPTVHPDAFTHFWKESAGAIYIPLTYTLWATIALFSRTTTNEFNISLNPAFFHAANLIIHVIAGWIVYAILKKILKNNLPAMLGAMIFLLHPVQVEAVAWISGLKDVLSGMLALAAVHQFVIYRQSEKKSHVPLILSVGWMILAMLAKPSAMVVPAILLAMDGLIFHTPFRRMIQTFTLYLIFAIPFIFIARYVQPASSIESPLWSRPLIAMDSIAFYLGKIVFPHPLVFDYGRTPARVIETGQIWWTPIITLSLMAGIVVLIRKKWRVPACALIIFIIGPSPVLGLVPFEFQDVSTVADHYLYVGVFGIALGGGWIASQFPRSRGWIVMVIGGLAIKSAIQTTVWKDHSTLMQHAFTHVPYGKVPANNLTALAIRRGHLPDALRYAQIALKNRPNEPVTLMNAAHVSLLMRQDEAAWELIRHNVTVYRNRYGPTDPRVAEAWVRAGLLFLDAGRMDDARRCGDEAAILAGQTPEIRALFEKLDERSHR